MEIKIPKGNPVCKPTKICCGLNYTSLHRGYLRNRRKVDTIILFKLFVSDCINGVFRSPLHALKAEIRFSLRQEQLDMIRTLET